MAAAFQLSSALLHHHQGRDPQPHADEPRVGRLHCGLLSWRPSSRSTASSSRSWETGSNVCTYRNLAMQGNPSPWRHLT